MTPLKYRAVPVAIGRYLRHDPGMGERTEQEVGDILKERREQLGLTQEDTPNVSSATVRKIENGTATSFRRASMLAYMDALGWPPNSRDRLIAGENPAEFTRIGGSIVLSGGI